MDIIKSLENDKVKYWNKLKLKKFRDNENLFLIEGDHLVGEALKKELLKEVIIVEGHDYNYNLSKHFVNKEVMAKISNMPSIPRIIGVCKKIEEQPYGNKILLIDSLQDPGNLGTIIRSAVAFDIDTIVLGDKTVDLYNEKTIRASEGMIFHVNVIKRELDTFIDELHIKKYTVYGTSVSNGITLNKIKKEEKYAFIVGNEGSGVSETISKKCDCDLYITMNKKCESLNVAVATGIILHALRGEE